MIYARLIGLLVNPKKILIIAGVLAAMFFAYQTYSFVDAKYAAEQRVEILEREADAYRESLRIMKEAAKQRQSAEDTANAVTDQIERDQDSYNRIMEGTRDEEDGPIAPVLRRALDELGRM